MHIKYLVILAYSWSIAAILVIFFDGVYCHMDSHRDFILHTYTCLMHLHTQKELEHCGIFSEIGDYFLKQVLSKL